MAETTHVLYFAYGSMCNITSLERRGLSPSVSCPAVLPGFTLRFDNVGGMADVLEGPPPPESDGEDEAARGGGPVYCRVPPEPASLPRGDATATASIPPPYLHGILHLITPKEWETLAAIEAVYTFRELPVVPYGPKARALLDAAAAAAASPSPPSSSPSSSSINARVFVGTPSAKAGGGSTAHELPTDRYIGIICAGLEEHGADAAWTELVRRLPCERTPAPGEHRRLPGFLTREEELSVAAAAAASSGGSSSTPHPLLPRRSRRWLARREGAVVPAVTFALAGRVFRAAMAPDNALRPIVERMVAGRDAAPGFCLNLYDPRLPPLGPLDPETGLPTLEEVHVGYAEDHFAKMLGGGRGPLAAAAAAGGNEDEDAIGGGHGAAAAAAGGSRGGAAAGSGAFPGGVRHVGWLVRDGEENDDDAPDEDEGDASGAAVPIIATTPS